jgi:hypothetical protein
MEEGTEYRVSWEMWVPEWPEPTPTEIIYSDKAAAENHYMGLLSMRADHEPRPCSEHVWNVKFQTRKKSVTEWE